MNKIRALIVDDERYAREELNYLLEQYKDIQVISEASRGEDAIITTIEKSPHVVFLDIEMPKKDGIEIAASLQQLKTRPEIIFTTAYPEFAVNAFRVNALDYLLKPYKKKELDEAINRLRGRMITKEKKHHRPQTTKLPVETDKDILYIDINDIVYLYPEGKISVIVTQSGKYEYK